jgi:23S rRNA pseudouridine1911/1915/1917 synthase
MSEPNIIFENDDFVVIDKPAGLMVHAVRRKEDGEKGKRRGEGKKRMQERKKNEAMMPQPQHEPTLTDWLVARWPAIAIVGDDPALRPGIVHRLDKGTSGVMIVAKTQAAFEDLKSLFQARAMKKTYSAFVVGVPREKKGIIDRPIGIKNGTLKRSVHAETMAKSAVTEYEITTKYCVPSDGPKSKEEEYALLEVRPRTGRTHQIRVHLASIGHPIVGDPLYGSPTISAVLCAPRLMLHARVLEFSDGEGNRYSFETPLPEEFIKVIHRVVPL